MNYGKKHDLPFGIMDVAGLLRLNIRRRAPGQVYVDCPICGDRRGKMNLNTAKDLWRCNYCGEGGGMLSLYAKVYGVSNSDAYREICDALAVNGFRRTIPFRRKLRLRRLNSLTRLLSRKCIRPSPCCCPC